MFHLPPVPPQQLRPHQFLFRFQCLQPSAWQRRDDKWKRNAPTSHDESSARFQRPFYSLSIFCFSFTTFQYYIPGVSFCGQGILFKWCSDCLFDVLCYEVIVVDVIVVFVVVVDDDVVLVGDVGRQNVICCCCRLSCCWFFSCRIHRKKCFVDKVTKRKWQQRTKRNDRKI